MKQIDLGLDLNTGRKRKQFVLDEINHVMPWTDLVRGKYSLMPGDQKGGFDMIPNVFCNT
jgi:hypothetical protein